MKKLNFTRVISKEKMCLITMLDEFIKHINSISPDDELNLYENATCIYEDLNDLWVFYGDHFGNKAKLELKELASRLNKALFTSRFELLQCLYICVLTFEDIKIQLTAPSVKISMKLRKALNDLSVEGGQSNDD